MSDIKIQPSATGSATVTLTAPTTGTARTVTLPDATGTLATTTDITGGANGVDFNDNVKARFGTGNDLEIYHNGSNSFISDVGTGNLKLVGTNIDVEDATGYNMVTMTAGGAVDIYYNHAKKFETTDEGAKVTGHLRLNNSQEMQLGGSATHIEGDSGYMAFDVNSAERMRIDSSGQVGIGATPISQGKLSVTQTNGGHWACKIVHTSTDAPVLLLQNAMNTSSFGNAHIAFLTNTSTEVGSIKCNNSATQYNTSSDYRLKENVDYTWDATTRLKQLKPARFNFIVDNTKTVDGFIAHEVSSVVPEAISGEKDAVDDDGNAVHQGIDQSKLVPLLVKTIQELEARITTLEG